MMHAPCRTSSWTQSRRPYRTAMASGYRPGLPRGPKADTVAYGRVISLFFVREVV